MPLSFGVPVTLSMTNFTKIFSQTTENTGLFQGRKRKLPEKADFRTLSRTSLQKLFFDIIVIDASRKHLPFFYGVH